MKKIIKLILRIFAKSVIIFSSKINAGFKLKQKRHSEIIEKSAAFNSFYNQIWTR